MDKPLDRRSADAHESPSPSPSAERAPGPGPGQDRARRRWAWRVGLAVLTLIVGLIGFGIWQHQARSRAVEDARAHRATMVPTVRVIEAKPVDTPRLLELPGAGSSGNGRCRPGSG